MPTGRRRSVCRLAWRFPPPPARPTEPERSRPGPEAVRLELAREIVLVSQLVIGRVLQAVVDDALAPGLLAVRHLLEERILHQRGHDLVPGLELRLQHRI